MRRPLVKSAVVLAISLVLLTGCAATYSQGPAASDIGTRVRIKAQGVDQGWVVGKLLELSSDSLRLLIVDSPDTVAVATQSLANFERSRKGSRAGRGAWIGLGIGAFAGAVVGASAYEGECSGCFMAPGFTTGQVAIMAGLFGGVVGLGVGALVGSTIHTENWQPISKPWIPGRELRVRDNVSPDCTLNC